MDTAECSANCKTWKDVLEGEKEQPYFEGIFKFLQKEKAQGKIIYPNQSDIFNALKLTSFESVKVVIIGQDPYHGANQAHGLCFSVQHGIQPPPSLQNIFAEMEQDASVPAPNHGNLTQWAERGVLLLNTILTVEAGKPQSHARVGWDIFTDQVIKILNDEKEGLVFLLWGAHAQRKAELIDNKKHHILEAAHPSPLSANRGFFGCQHFSKTNELLEKAGKEPMDWRLDDI